MNAVWQGLVDATIIVHFVFLLYVLIGGFVAWRWPFMIFPHVLAAGWAVLIVTTDAHCPLTAAQNGFRAQQGLPPLHDGFIEVYVRGAFYPASGETVAQLVLAAVVVASWVGFVRRRAVGRRSRADRRLRADRQPQAVR